MDIAVGVFFETGFLREKSVGAKAAPKAPDSVSAAGCGI
jgi:hypothetical protein